MSELLKVGDKIRCINEYSVATTKGNVYEIEEVDGTATDGRIVYYYVDDDADDYDMDSIRHDTLTKYFEVVRNPHAEPMGREFGAGVNGKLLRIYTGTDVEGDFHTHVTVGIDEATGVMYVLGMKTEVV